MTLDLYLCLLAAFLGYMIPWTKVWERIERRYALACGRRIRRQLERETGARILVYCRRIERRYTFRLCKRIRATPPGTTLILVLDTCGGDPNAGIQVARALADHPGKLIVRVPDEAWSAGTDIALVADEVVLGPDANLGPIDSWATYDPNTLWPAHIRLAQQRGVTVEQVRAHDILTFLTNAAIDSRAKRTRNPEAARKLVERFTMWGDHALPFFAEKCRELGLEVTTDPDLRWLDMAIAYGWSRPRGE